VEPMGQPYWKKAESSRGQIKKRGHLAGKRLETPERRGNGRGSFRVARQGGMGGEKAEIPKKGQTRLAVSGRDRPAMRGGLREKVALLNRALGCRKKSATIEARGY